MWILLSASGRNVVLLLERPQISADHCGRRVREVLPAVSEGHPEGPRGDVSRRSASAPRALPQKLPAAVHPQHPAGRRRAGRVRNSRRSVLMPCCVHSRHHCSHGGFSLLHFWCKAVTVHRNDKLHGKVWNKTVRAKWSEFCLKMFARPWGFKLKTVSRLCSRRCLSPAETWPTTSHVVDVLFFLKKEWICVVLL